jgi:FtsH-binding integral membrane protein
MNFGPAERFRALQQQYSDPALTLLTVLLLLLMFVVAPLQATGFLAFQGGFGVVVAVVMIGGVLVISGSVVAATTTLIAFSLIDGRLRRYFANTPYCPHSMQS